MKKGFTLAEVLITLVIIGIVAALTISILASKNEKKQLYVQFMNTYSTISNAFNLAKIDHGDPSTWKTSMQGNPNYIKTYLQPYLTNAKVCDHIKNCFASDYKDLTGASQSEMINAFFSMNPPIYTIQLPSGAAIIEIQNVLAIDTNGQKGPNTYGRDIFTIELTRTNDSSCKSDSPFCPNRDPEDCLDSKGFEGDACYQKLIKDGGMKY